jgi:hypothetical protein
MRNDDATRETLCGVVRATGDCGERRNIWIGGVNGTR